MQFDCYCAHRTFFFVVFYCQATVRAIDNLKPLVHIADAQAYGMLLAAVLPLPRRLSTFLLSSIDMSPSLIMAIFSLSSSA